MLLRPLGIQAKITWLAFGVVLVSLLLGIIVFFGYYVRNLEREIGFRALAIARTLSQNEQLQQNINTDNGREIIQAIAEKTRLATNVEYVVVVDMNRRRLSHPLESFIGSEFGGGDEGPAFADHEYISRAEGILGPSIRAFVPLKADEGTRQVGIIVVGVLTPTWQEIIKDLRWEIYLSLLAGLLTGILGSIYLARDIKRTLFNLEPREIARLLEERVAIFQSMGDGIIAIDREQRITVFNEAARRIIGVKMDPIGRRILDVIPDSRLPLTATKGDAFYNQERTIGEANILASRFPIKVKGEIVGAVSLIRDKTEVHRLAEELTGVKEFIEALRVQSHEYMNKLHTIAGLLQLQRYQEAIDFVFQVSEEQHELASFLGNKIKDYSVAGLLLGKYSRGKELRIELNIDRASQIDALQGQGESAMLVIILGNLLDNGMEAVQEMPANRRQVWCSIKQMDDELIIIVKDTGTGIPKHLWQDIFATGFSTKGRGSRGYGLGLVKQYVDNAGGKIELDSILGEGTTFTIVLPIDRGGGNHDRDFNSGR